MEWYEVVLIDTSVYLETFLSIDSFLRFYSKFFFPQVEKRALEIWGSEEKLLEELENREEKRMISKQKSYQKKMKSVFQFFVFFIHFCFWFSYFELFAALKMSIRSSLYTRALTESHTHEFGEETYNSDDDTYSHFCVSCDYKETYEKMWFNFQWYSQIGPGNLLELMLVVFFHFICSLS